MGALMGLMLLGAAALSQWLRIAAIIAASMGTTWHGDGGAPIRPDPQNRAPWQAAKAVTAGRPRIRISAHAHIRRTKGSYF